MDLKNNRLVIETQRDAFEAQSYIRKSVERTSNFLGTETKFYTLHSVKPVKDNIANLDEIVEERQELPFELYPSTSKLVIDGMRKVANGKTQTPDENVRRTIAANHLVTMNIPLSADAEPMHVTALAPTHEL